ncbi:uncharacterized protein LOC123423862 [Hordeum vulgare subsp. vulgare]|nr:uncharacterized protein LOC123423862 [Hordeum vulgare subsp. vulgare]
MSPSARHSSNVFHPFYNNASPTRATSRPSTGPHASPRYFLPPFASPSPPSTLDFSSPRLYNQSPAGYVCHPPPLPILLCSALLRSALLPPLHPPSEKSSPSAEGSTMAGTANCIDIILAIILPPLGVFLKFGCGHEFWICLLLTFLGYIPGIIYAIYAITK